MKQMYKVLFSYKEDSPSGGNTQFSGYKTEIKLYDAENSEELQKKIDGFLADNKCGYRKHIIVRDITKL